MKSNLYAAIDIGTSKVCVLVGRVESDSKLQILGVGLAPSQGVHQSQISNMNDCKVAVKRAVQEAQQFLGKKIGWAYVGVTGKHITSVNATSASSESRTDEAISPSDLDQLLGASYPPNFGDREVLHLIPQNYIVDGLKGIRNPVGMHADHLAVQSSVVVAEISPLRNVIQVVENCGVSVRSLVLELLATGEVVLTRDEREMGVILVDIGAGTSDVAIYREGVLWHTFTIPVGGYHLSRDLSIALGLPFNLAEEAKLRWGCAVPELVDESQEVLLPSFQGAPKQTINRRELCYPIKERATEILGLILRGAKEAGLDRMPHGGLVITGGTANLKGIEELAKIKVPAHVRIGRPRGVLGLPDELYAPEFATATGILLWGIKHQAEKRSYKKEAGRLAWLQGYRGLFGGYKGLVEGFKKTKSAS